MKRRTALITVGGTVLVAAGLVVAVPNLMHPGHPHHADSRALASTISAKHSAPQATASGTPAAGSGAAPSSRFNLADWELQLPTGPQGDPTTISPTALTGGYTNQDYFFLNSAGQMTFWAPENGVHTPHSQYGRSELRQMNPDGSLAEWKVTENHTLSATVAVPDVTKRVCVGQVHLGTGGPSTKVVTELFYDADGQITLGVAKSPDGGQTMYPLGTVALGQNWTYSITVDDHRLRVSVNGTETSYPIPASFDRYNVYFKAGSYNQSSSDSATNGARVEFSALSLS